MIDASYYNENNPQAATWLRNLIRGGLIGDGEVDDRSIADVQASDVAGYAAAHFFAGIAGWPYALQLAGWPANRQVWTGSCPCQPFSIAGAGGGETDERHLWPELRRLIAECRPATVFGEQVASPDGRRWLAGVRADLESLGYAVGAADLCAAGVAAPHIRQRLYWVADASCERRWEVTRGALSDEASHGGTRRNGREAHRHHEFDGCGEGLHRLADRHDGGSRQRAGSGSVRPQGGHDVGGGGADGRLGHADDTRPSQRLCERRNNGAERQTTVGASWQCDPWADYELIHCLDGADRRIGSGLRALAYGIPAGLGRDVPALRGVVARAKSSRIAGLKGYGNAIVPQVAAMFVRAFMGGDQ